MPLYEYECTVCHTHTEKIQKFSDPEITACPHCGGHLERVLSAPAISFKGGGWFADGYGSTKPSASGNGTSKAAGSAKADSSDASTDSGKSAEPAVATPVTSSATASSPSMK